MSRVIQQGLVWAPVLKAGALFVLPLPLLLAVLGGLIEGDVPRLAFAGSALASFWGAGVLALRGLVVEARYCLGERLDAPFVPLKVLSAIPTALGSTLAATAAGHEPAGAVVFGGLGVLGHLAFFGRDPRPQRIQVAAVAGVDRDAVMVQLKEAYRRLRGIEGAAAQIAVPEFRERLARITSIARAVLGEIERDPADATRARRFLNLYLDSAERVTVDYARTHTRSRNAPLEQNFRKLLVDMETTFSEQHRRLVEREQLLLDVDIEVLNARLSQEGPG